MGKEISRQQVRDALVRAKKLELIREFRVVVGNGPRLDRVEIKRAEEALQRPDGSTAPEKAILLTLDLALAYYYLLGLGDGYRVTINAKITPRRRKALK